MIPAQRRIHRKQADSEAAKPPSRFGCRNNSLPHLHSGEPEEEDLSRTTPTVHLPLAASFSNLSISSQTKHSPQPRSSSVTKVRGKAANSGKTAYGEIGKQVVRPDSAMQKAAKRHKKVLSLQLMTESTHKSGFGSCPFTKTANALSKQKGGQIEGIRGDSIKMKTGTPGVVESVERWTDWEEVERELESILLTVPATDVKGQSRVYHRFFSDAVRSSGALSGLLSRLQEGYERLLDELQERLTTEVSKHQSEVIQLQNNILREAEERKTLVKKIEKLSRENVEMSQACESYEGKITEFQEKLFDIASVSLDEFPPTEEAWRLLNSELDYYKGWKKKAARELKITHSKEKKLIKLVHALKSRGFPVEEVYNNEVRTPAVPHAADSHQPDENESVRLVSGKPKNHQRPAGVPSLNLSTVEPDVTSESDSDSGELSEADMTLRKAISAASAHVLDDMEKSERTQGMGRGKLAEGSKVLLADGGTH